MKRIKSFLNSDYIKTLFTYLIIIIIVVIIRVFIIDPVRVDGESMNTTLADGEILLLDKIHYRKNAVQRFDIVVVKQSDKYIIKRIIGMPGEHIEYRDNKLYINGKITDDPYPSTETDDFSIENIGHVKVPGNCYFVMGDNRASSLDSRYAEVGVIKREKIIGKAKIIIWPFKKFGIAK